MSRATEFSLRIYNRLADRIVPGHKHAQRSYQERLAKLVFPGCSWLDLGCGHQLLPSWLNADERGFVQQCRRAVGIDLDFPSLRANATLRDRTMGPLEHLPFRDGTFDLVTANMVIEHIQNPAIVLAEVKRVLRPGGRFLFHTPNRNAPAIRIASHTPDGLKKRIIWLFERRREEDVFPTHYQMNTEPDIHRMAQDSGFSVDSLEQLGSTAVTAYLGPLAVPELLFVRALQADRFRGLRSNILTVLRKP